MELFKSLLESSKKIFLDPKIQPPILWSNRPEIIQCILNHPTSKLFADLKKSKHYMAATIIPFLESNWQNNKQLAHQFLDIFSNKSKAKIRIWYYAKISGKKELSKDVVNYFGIDLSSTDVLKYILFLICNTNKKEFHPTIRQLAEETINNPNTPINAPLDFSKKENNPRKHTALHFALYRNNDLLKLLIKHQDINPHIENYTNDTAFDIAIEHGDISSIKSLLSTKKFSISALETNSPSRLCKIYELLAHDNNKLKYIFNTLKMSYKEKIQLMENELKIAASAKFDDELRHNTALFSSFTSYITFCTHWHRELTMSEEHYQAPLLTAQKHFYNVQESCHALSAQYIAKEKIYHVFLRLSPVPASDTFIANILNYKGLPADIIKLILKLNCQNNSDRYIANYAQKNSNYYNQNEGKQNSIKHCYQKEQFERIENMKLE